MEHKVIKFKFNNPVYYNGRSHFEMYSILIEVDGEWCPLRRIGKGEPDVNGNGWVAQHFTVEDYKETLVNITINEILMDSSEAIKVKASLVTFGDLIKEFEYCD